MRRFAVAITFVSVLAGCAAKEHLPPYHWVDSQTALRDLSRQAHAVRTLSAEATVSLAKRSGDSVRLDAAVAMQPPEQLRLRAWKFSQSVFDLTINRDGVYLVSPDGAALRTVGAGEFGKMWAKLNGGFFDDPNLELEEDGARLVITSNAGGQRVRCEVDRATLTPRRYAIIDPAGATRFTLSLDRYADHGGVVYPHRLMAVSEQGKIVIELRNIEINAPLADNAFHPPRRAEKIP